MNSGQSDISGFARMSGRFRLWDVQLILQGGDDYQVEYASLTEDGTPLFVVYRRPGRSAVAR